MKIILFLFLITSNVYALTPIEAWIRLTCIGPVTPKRYVPVEEKTIKVFHLQVGVQSIYPSMYELRDMYSNKFKEFTQICTDTRLAMVDVSKLTPGKVWLDWDTDHQYTRFQMSEDFIYNAVSCRAVNKPCTANTQCCYNGNGVSCNLATNTCEGTPPPPGPISIDKSKLGSLVKIPADAGTIPRGPATSINIKDLKPVLVKPVVPTTTPVRQVIPPQN